MKSIGKILHWVDTHLLLLLSLFLLAFIPLFPKIPLFDILPGYIVRVRMEDFLVFFTALVWLRDVFKRRVQWNSSYFWFVLLYAFAGLLSIFFGVFLLQSIPFELLHIGKSGLTFFRYLEYFSVFFFLFSAIKTKQHVLLAIGISVCTLLGVVGYGIGQKYAHFPVYSTMNREYSKGEKLYLQEGARPQSTFGGHYDLAAYLVIILPILFSVALGGIHTSSVIGRFVSIGILLVSHILGVGMLVLSGSRISLIGHLFGIGIVVLLHVLRIPSIKVRAIIGGTLVLLGIFACTGIWMTDAAGVRSKAQSIFARMQNPTQSRPEDVVGEGHEFRKVETVSEETGEVTSSIISVQSTWSQNALKYGLSMGIRLDTLWPQALLGFAYNPPLGSGYGTLAMLGSTRFVEADSTDNNFLRTLGETGLIGVVLFYGIIALLIKDMLKARIHEDALSATLSIGFVGSIVGLLVTALYLDVFAASKVAFMFWTFAGLLYKTTHMGIQERKMTKALEHIRSCIAHCKKHGVLYITILLTFFVLHQNPYTKQTVLHNIDAYPQALEELASARCMGMKIPFALCRQSGHVVRPFFSLYALVLTPFVSLLSPLPGFYYANLLLILLSLGVCYRLLSKQHSQREVFGVLLILLTLASLLRLTFAPLTVWQFVLVVGGLPLLSYLYGKQHESVFLATYRKIRVIAVIGTCVVLFASTLGMGIVNRFRGIATNTTYTALNLINALVRAKEGSNTYVISSINPFYTDLFGTGAYETLPLSTRQEYGSDLLRVWNIPTNRTLDEHYTQLLSSSARLFISDYQTQKGDTYHDRFVEVKKNFDLSYIELGCDERCSLLSFALPIPKLSAHPVSPITNTTVNIEALSPPLSFAVISNRFDGALEGKLLVPYDTRQFGERLGSVLPNDLSFAIISGDVVHKPEEIHADIFTSTLANKVPYPLLVSLGNEDIIKKKLYPGGFQTFFTPTTFFILLPTTKDSTLSKEDHLALYNAFLVLEKLPQMKTLFIISHNLDWQNDTNNNTQTILYKKLQDFPALHTYILTAQHASDRTRMPDWFTVTKDEEKGIKYVASLVAGSPRDVYVQVLVSEQGNVTLTPKRLVQ